MMAYEISVIMLTTRCAGGHGSTPDICASIGQ
jgi:hypothetical protein